MSSDACVPAPGEASMMRRALAAACREQGALLAQPAQATIAVALLRNAARIVALALACHDEEAAMRAADVGAAAAAAAVLLARGAAVGDDGFTVQLDWGGVLPEAARLSVPAGPAELYASDWLLGFAVAALARDGSSLGLLAAPATLVALEQAPSAGDTSADSAPDAPAWALRLAPMLCAAARRDAPMARESGAMPPAVADAGAAPRALWQAARRLAAGDAAGSLEQAIAALHAASQGGTTDLPARALIALALADGATLPATAQPSGVTMPARRWRRPALRVRHALRSVLRGDEARWFLDLAGYPRSVRRHHIVHRALGEPAREQLVVCYEMQATAATPPASAEFVLLEPGDAAAGGMPAPLALDAGQLLWLAETLARGEPSVAMLEEAVGCARAALQRLGPAERLTEAQLRSPQGRQLWQAEPGRFSRVRLTAYADALAAALTARRLEARAPEPVDATASADPVEAFRRAVQGAEAVQQVVAPLLDALRHADAAALVAHLHPQAQDYRKVFVGTAAEAARQAYEALWAQPASLFRPPSPEQTALHVHVAPAGLLGTDVDMVRPFPLGYRAIAPLLDPHRVWVCWKYTRPELASGLAYDGLVWCDDHWAWFPKPYRRLASLLASPPDRSES